ncbi:MAG: DUF6049 family protein [Pseudonocardiaceae bacterium]
MRHSVRGQVVVPTLLIAVLLGFTLPGVVADPSPAHQRVHPLAYQSEQPQTLARIELVDMSPRVVTAASPSILTVTGRVVNVGDRPITKLGVRLQLDDPVTSDEAASRAIRGVPGAPHVTRFRPLRDDLAPGQSSSFQLDVLLRGEADQESLRITEPGVYPLLVNLNGKPDFGGTARLAAVPLLLPVLGVPASTPGGQPGPVLSPPTEPTPLTVVWPLAAEPARLPVGPGEPILLTGNGPGSDPIAAQLAPGGRLDGLVGALEQAVPPGSALASAVCVAIDPLLLETVDAMGRGYRVAHPRGIDSQEISAEEISEGTGAQDARNWLDRLRSAVQGRCVLPLPYADPDLVALSRAGLTDLEALAGSTGVRLVRTLLGVQPLTGVTWPAGGVLDERTLADLTTLQIRAVLLEPRGLTVPPATNPALDSATNTVRLAAGVPGSSDTAALGLLTDPLLTGALDPNAVVETPGPRKAAEAPDPGAVSRVPDPGAVSRVPDPGVVIEALRPRGNETTVAARPTDTANPLAAQDGLGALVYRAGMDPDPEPLLLVPPRRWQASGTEATALLRTARGLVEGGFFTPRELTGLADTDPAGSDDGTNHAAVNYPLRSSATEVSSTVTAQVKQARDVLRDLHVATERDATVDLEPAELLDPLRLGLLRGVSSAWADQPDRAEQVTGEVLTGLDELLGSVRIVPPPGTYTLAASDSPLLITVSNELPAAMQVQLTLSETAGLQIGTIDVALVPARSTRQFVIPTEISRAGQFSVNARLSTPSGTALGRPSTLQLRSTAFGTITVALTAGAGAALIVLIAHRIIRRIRRPQTVESGGDPRERGGL